MGKMVERCIQLYESHDSCMSRGCMNCRMTPAGTQTYTLQSLLIFSAFFFPIAANGEFPPVATSITQLPLRPTDKTPLPSIKSPPMNHDTIVDSKCVFLWTNHILVWVSEKKTFGVFFVSNCCFALSHTLTLTYYNEPQIRLSCWVWC